MSTGGRGHLCQLPAPFPHLRNRGGVGGLPEGQAGVGGWQVRCTAGLSARCSLAAPRPPVMRPPTQQCHPALAPLPPASLAVCRYPAAAGDLGGEGTVYRSPALFHVLLTGLDAGRTYHYRVGGGGWGVGGWGCGRGQACLPCPPDLALASGPWRFRSPHPAHTRHPICAACHPPTFPTGWRRRRGLVPTAFFHPAPPPGVLPLHLWDPGRPRVNLQLQRHHLRRGGI